MKQAERDELLGRIEERTRNTYHLVEKLEHHNAEQNGYIFEQGKQVASNKASIKWIRIILIGAGLIGGGITGITQLLG